MSRAILADGENVVAVVEEVARRLCRGIGRVETCDPFTHAVPVAHVPSPRCGVVFRSFLGFHGHRGVGYRPSELPGDVFAVAKTMPSAFSRSNPAALRRTM